MLTITYLLAQAAFRSREPVGHQCQVWGWGRCPGGLGDALWGAGGSAVGCGGSCREPAGSVVSAPCVSPCRALPSVPAQEFENAEGDDYVTEFSAQGSPAPQHGPEVYVLPLTEVSLPMAKQPGRSGKLPGEGEGGKHWTLWDPRAPWGRGGVRPGGVIRALCQA